jgi:hypothetical protein
MREHFEPRGRGVLPTQLREGSYFTGRTAVLSDLASWLHHQGDGRRCLVLTGSPGSGKSAVLVRLMTQYPRLMIVAVHGRGRQVDEVADEIAVGLGLLPGGASGPLAALRSARPDRVVMVDAVDEAVRPYLLIQDLLEPLAASSAVTGLRCVFGTRRGGDGQLLKAFGDSVTVYDLDAPEYASGADVAEYVRRTLLAEADPQVRTPYRDDPTWRGRWPMPWPCVPGRASWSHS